jgi:CRISPR-associated protein Cmr5
MHTRSQKFAQAAYPRIQTRHTSLQAKQFKEYVTFAKKFPALVHTCGLAQAVAFAVAKKETDYISDLSEVLRASGHAELTAPTSLLLCSQSAQLGDYMRLSRDAISAASWLKRYVEAVAPKVPEEDSK